MTLGVRMEIKVKANEGKRLDIEFQTTDLTIPDLIATALLKISDVEFAGVSKDHPEIGKPVLVIKSKRKKPAEDLESAIESLQEDLADLTKQLSATKKR